MDSQGQQVRHRRDTSTIADSGVELVIEIAAFAVLSMLVDGRPASAVRVRPRRCATPLGLYFGRGGDKCAARVVIFVGGVETRSRQG
jgi:hypothetical protein